MLTFQSRSCMKICSERVSGEPPEEQEAVASLEHTYRYNRPGRILGSGTARREALDLQLFTRKVIELLKYL